jgi:hypothetical protein
MADNHLHGPPGVTIYVRGLPTKIVKKSKDLKELMTPYGEVIGATLALGNYG